MKIMGIKPLQTFMSSPLTDAQKIVSDTTHILHIEFQLLPLDRIVKVPQRRFNPYKITFNS